MEQKTKVDYQLDRAFKLTAEIDKEYKSGWYVSQITQTWMGAGRDSHADYLVIYRKD